MLQKLKTHWLRLRYRMALADLNWMENRVHACLQEQRDQVAEIARRLDEREGDVCNPCHSAEDVRRTVERCAKWGGLA